MCNNFQCAGLKELQEALAATSSRPVLVVATSGEVISRSILINSEGTQVRKGKVAVVKK
jgi:hypothetical protein